MDQQLNAGVFLRLVAAGTPLLLVVTSNEPRSEALIARALQQGFKDMPEPRTWTCTDGFAGQQDTADPARALCWAAAQQGRGVYLFKDLHWFWQDNPYIQRQLKELPARAALPEKCWCCSALSSTFRQPFSPCSKFCATPCPTGRRFAAICRLVGTRMALSAP